LPNEYVVKPSWSPNGDWIAFLNESGFQGDLFLVRPDGSDLSRLTYSNDISRDGNLVWSPDGSRIGFSALQDGRIEIFTLEVERALHGQSSIRQLTDSSGLSHNLITSWSPDGSRIAFSSDREGNAEIYLMDIDSSNIVRLTDNPFSDTAPGFSPDGSQIVFLSNRYKGDIEIFVMDVAEAIQDPANAIVRRLTDHKGEEAGSVWKPAGRP
jgi:Tol biopolymer transport system component